jgi:hypothetical protein
MQCVFIRTNSARILEIPGRGPGSFAPGPDQSGKYFFPHGIRPEKNTARRELKRPGKFFRRLLERTKFYGSSASSGKIPVRFPFGAREIF